MKALHRRCLYLFAVLLVLGVLAPSDSQAFVITFDQVFNGSAPTSAPPYLTATFTQDGADRVSLLMESSLETTGEFFGEVAFNIDPSVVPSDLVINFLSGVQADNVGHSTQNGQFLQGSGNEHFDILFDFPVAPPPDRFQGMLTSSYEFLLPGITPEFFNFLNDGGLIAGAHVQGIPLPGGGTTSGAVTGGPTRPVPEPGTFALLGMGLTGAAVMIRRRRAGI